MYPFGKNEYTPENQHDTGKHHLKMYLLLKIVIFHCHVSFRGVTPNKMMSEKYIWSQDTGMCEIPPIMQPLMVIAIPIVFLPIDPEKNIWTRRRDVFGTANNRGGLRVLAQSPSSHTFPNPRYCLWLKPCTNWPMEKSAPGCLGYLLGMMNYPNYIRGLLKTHPA